MKLRQRFKNLRRPERCSKQSDSDSPVPPASKNDVRTLCMSDVGVTDFECYERHIVQNPGVCMQVWMGIQ